MNKAELSKALRPEDDPRIMELRTMMESGGMDNLHPALKPWVTDSTIGSMLKHPFVYMPLGGYEMFAQRANEIYKHKIEIRRKVLNERNFYSYFWLLERPWRMHALELLWRRKRISRRELRSLLIDIWIDTECPQSNQDVPVKLFRELKFTTNTYAGWKKLPDEITVYRGVDGELELTADGPSWTTDLKVAKFFAYRYGAEGCVYRYTLKKPEALAYITSRDESEIILDFDPDFGRSYYGDIEVREGKDRPEFWS